MTKLVNNTLRNFFVIGFSAFVVLFNLVGYVGAQEGVLDDVAGFISEDESVVAEDFGLSDTGVLPGSIFYGVKDFWRGFKTNFIFDKVGKAEARLDIANERLLEAEALLEVSGGDEQMMGVGEAVLKIQKEVDRFKDQIEGLDDRSDERVIELLKKYADGEIKRQKVFDKIERGSPENMKVTIIEARNESSESFGEILSSSMSVDELGEVLDGVAKNQVGSKFKDLKSIEVLERLKEKVPESARAAIEMAQVRAMDRVEKSLNESSGESDIEKVKSYLVNSAGSALRKLKVLDRMESSDDLDGEVRDRISDLKDRLSSRVGEELGRMAKKELRDKYLDAVSGGEMEDVKVLEGIADGVGGVELSEKREEVKNRFRDRVVNLEGEEKEAFKKKVGDGIDMATLRVIKELEGDGTASGRANVEEIQKSVAEVFVKKFNERRDEFLERITTDNPEDLEVLEEMKDEVDASQRTGLERALDVQMRNLKRKLEKMVNSDEALEFKMKIEEREEARSVALKKKPQIIEDAKKVLVSNEDVVEKMDERQLDVLERGEVEGGERNRFKEEVDKMDAQLPGLKKQMQDLFSEVRGKELPVDEDLRRGVVGGSVSVSGDEVEDEGGLSGRAEKRPVDLGRSKMRSE